MQIISVLITLQTNQEDSIGN